MREDILEGLKSAILRGESLKQAMQSLYNAGYDAKDIEEAARFLQTASALATRSVSKEEILKKTIQNLYSKGYERKKIEETAKVLQKGKPKLTKGQILPIDKTIPKVPPRVSGYGRRKFKRQKFIFITVLTFVLLVLVGTLIGIFLFRKELLDLLGRLF
jgi:hypothetical protein